MADVIDGKEWAISGMKDESMVVNSAGERDTKGKEGDDVLDQTDPDDLEYGSLKEIINVDKANEKYKVIHDLQVRIRSVREEEEMNRIDDRRDNEGDNFIDEEPELPKLQMEWYCNDRANHNKKPKYKGLAMCHMAGNLMQDKPRLDSCIHCNPTGTKQDKHWDGQWERWVDCPIRIRRSVVLLLDALREKERKERLQKSYDLTPPSSPS